MLIVMVDANRVGGAARRQEIADAIDESVFPAVVVGTPDPCVERWLLADPVAFAERFGVEPDVANARTGADWKRELVEALGRAGEIVTQGGAEFADEILSNTNFYRAGRSVPSISDFTDEVRRALRRLA